MGLSGENLVVDVGVARAFTSLRVATCSGSAAVAEHTDNFDMLAKGRDPAAKAKDS